MEIASGAGENAVELCLLHSGTCIDLAPSMDITPVIVLKS